MLVVVMGVTGSGKSTVGERLAGVLGLPFIEGDGFHEPANIEKMRRGEALNDEDRAIWLDRLNEALRLHRSTGAVLACSALTKRARRRLAEGVADIELVYLRADEQVLRERLRHRTGHFAGVELLDSQLATLEEPDCALVVDDDDPPDVIVERVVRGLRAHPPTSG